MTSLDVKFIFEWPLYHVSSNVRASLMFERLS